MISNQADRSIFHLAIPCRDVVEAIKFYEKLGGIPQRVYEDHATIYFYGHQLVVHQSPDCPKNRQVFTRDISG